MQVKCWDVLVPVPRSSKISKSECNEWKLNANMKIEWDGWMELNANVEMNVNVVMECEIWIEEWSWWNLKSSLMRWSLVPVQKNESKMNYSKYLFISLFIRQIVGLVQI